MNEVGTPSPDPRLSPARTKWFALGALQYGDPLGIKVHVSSSHQSLTGLLAEYAGQGTALFTTNTLAQWLRTTVYAAGWTHIFGPDWLYDTFTYLYAAGIFGALGLCLLGVWRQIRARRAAPFDSPRWSRPARVCCWGGACF